MFLEGFCHWLLVPGLQANPNWRILGQPLKEFPPDLQKHRSKHKTVWIPAYAGMTHCAPRHLVPPPFTQKCSVF